MASCRFCSQSTSREGEEDIWFHAFLLAEHCLRGNMESGDSLERFLPCVPSLAGISCRFSQARSFRSFVRKAPRARFHGVCISPRCYFPMATTKASLSPLVLALTHNGPPSAIKPPYQLVLALFSSAFSFLVAAWWCSWPSRPCFSSWRVPSESSLLSRADMKWSRHGQRYLL